MVIITTPKNRFRSEFLDITSEEGKEKMRDIEKDVFKLEKERDELISIKKKADTSEEKRLLSTKINDISDEILRLRNERSKLLKIKETRIVE